MIPGSKAPRWAWWVATGLGSGYLRPAPGTWGSLAAVAAWCAALAGVRAALAMLLNLTGASWLFTGFLVPQAFMLVLTLALTWLAVRASDRVVEETGAKDPATIVADEWAGQWIALWPVTEMALVFASAPASAAVLGLPKAMFFAALLGVPFIFFRLFDVWKPWPCHQLQDLPKGQGVVADDVVAGLYALPFAALWVKMLPLLFR